MFITGKEISHSILYHDRKNIRIPATSFIGTSNPHLDLAILSISSHNVIDYGTFGVWVRTLPAIITTGKLF